MFQYMEPRWSVTSPLRCKPPRRLVDIAVLSAVGLSLSACGRHYVLLDPAGPVAASELRLVETVSIAMAVVIAFVFVLFAIVLVRFRDKPGNKAPYTPEWAGGRWLEILLFAIPVVIVAFIAVPTVRKTFALSRLPARRDPLVVDVTSLDWKWFFEYPTKGVATVNHIDIPVGVPVLFEMTADSPMNTFWVPRLGGMEFTMPGRVLPLWLQADHPGVYRGRSANFSGKGFVRMAFDVRAVSPARFAAWISKVRRTAPPLTIQGYRRLLRFGPAGHETYSAYPKRTFPTISHGFSLQGGMYVVSSLYPGHRLPPAGNSAR